jgi:hypothetical protein
MVQLDAVLSKMNVHEKLPKRSWLWGDDQRSNLASIDQLLDEVIVMLRISDLNQPRQLIRYTILIINEHSVSFCAFHSSPNGMRFEC